MTGELFYAAVVVITVAVGALLIGLLMLGSMAGAYDDIGAGMFDRPRGHRDDRGPCDAEYEEYGAALAALCEEEERSAARS